MPRKLRLHQPGGFYHATLRGNHQQAIFFADPDRQLLNTIVARAIDTYEARLHAYCWMTNHLHFLVQVSGSRLADPMRNIAAEYARAMQIKLHTTGHFFERRYHATLVDADSYLLELVRYIHRNPVSARLVDHPGLYQWSSHHAYIGSRFEPWVTTDFALGMFSSDRARAIVAYRKFVQRSADVSWASSMASNGGDKDMLGNDGFVSRASRCVSTPRSRQSLEELIAEACQRFSVERAQFESPVRDVYLAKVRAWIAYQAGKRGIATLSAVARAIGRDEATLRYAIRAYPSEIE